MTDRMTDALLSNAITAWEWLADPTNSELIEQTFESDEKSIEGEPFVGDAFIPLDARRFSTNALHKQKFGGLSKESLNEILSLLQEAGVVGVPFSLPTGGRPKELRHISADWLCSDNKDALERLKTKLTEMLTQVLYARQANSYAQQTAEKITGSPSTDLGQVATDLNQVATDLKPSIELNQPTVDSKIELAIKIFDWISDPENFEVDARNKPFFSVELLRRALGVENSELHEALGLLQRAVVIGTHFTDPVRARKLHHINESFVKGKDRERLLRILKHQPSTPYVPVGPSRVLKEVSVYVQKQLMTFKENDIVSNEAYLSVLIKAGAILAPLSDANVRLCLNQKCRHRFDISESVTDFPVLEAIRRDIILFGFGGTSISVIPGDVITDRAKCLFLTSDAMKDRGTFRVLEPDRYTCCPQCKNVVVRPLIPIEHNVPIERNLQAAKI